MRATDFYPATGFRDSGFGGLYSVGTGGNSWNSSPAGTASVYGSYVDFNSSVVNSENGNNRAFGFPVRCVQE